MNRIIKGIPAFSLWLAWLIITAHLIIPHDHHSSDLYGNKEDTCPHSQNNTRHNHGFPVHCHAFNDLASEKAVTYSIDRNIQHFDFTLNIYYKNLANKLSFSGLIVFETEKQLLNSESAQLSLLRGPPSIWAV